MSELSSPFKIVTLTSSSPLIYVGFGWIIEGTGWIIGSHMRHHIKQFSVFLFNSLYNVISLKSNNTNVVYYNALFFAYILLYIE